MLSQVCNSSEWNSLAFCFLSCGKLVCVVWILPDQHCFSISSWYCSMLLKLKQNIKNKCREKLLVGIVFLQDNAKSHVAKKILNLLKAFQWEIFRHLPYSLSISLYDCYIFGRLKKALKGQLLICNKKVQSIVEKWTCKQPRSSTLQPSTLFLRTGILVSISVTVMFRCHVAH